MGNRHINVPVLWLINKEVNRYKFVNPDHFCSADRDSRHAWSP